MTNSLNLHGALTEDVRENVSGKGREGNKEGKGSRGESSIHSHLGNAREAASTSVGERASSWMGQIR